MVRAVCTGLTLGAGSWGGTSPASHPQAPLFHILRYRVEALRSADSSTGLVTYSRA